MSAIESSVAVSARWEDRYSLVGREFRSAWIQVTTAEADGFNTITRVDDNEHELAAAVFPDGLVEGFHLLSLLDHVVNSVLFIENPRWTGFNYGLDRVRFVSSVTTNDRVRAVGRVESFEEKASGSLALITCTFDVEGRDKPGLIADWRVLWLLAPEGVGDVDG